nr:hypothetical protein [Angustibacter aerolatus]
MTVSDYVATLLADAHGMPEYAPSRVASRPQEEPAAEKRLDTTKAPLAGGACRLQVKPDL